MKFAAVPIFSNPETKKILNRPSGIKDSWFPLREIESLGIRGKYCTATGALKQLSCDCT